MKNIILLVIFTLISTAAFTQVNWKKWYGEPNRNEILTAAEAGSDSTHYWAAGTIANGTHDDFWFVKMDAQGQKIWSDTLGNPDRNERLSDFSRNPTTGEMWLIGDSRPSGAYSNLQVFLQKLDASGALIFEKTGLFVTTQNTWSNFNIKTVGDGALVFYQELGLLRRLDASANVVWERAFSSSTDTYNRQILSILPDGGCFFADNFSNQCVLHRLDANGQTVWQVNIDFPPNLATGCRAVSVLADLADASVFVAVQGGNYHGIQKFAENGQLLWESDLDFMPWFNDFLHPWLLHFPAKNQIALFSSHAHQILDDQTGAFVAGENNFVFNQTTGFVFLNDGVVLDKENFAVVGTTSDNDNSYDGYSAKMRADDFQILQKNTFGTPSFFDVEYEARTEPAENGDYFLSALTFFEESRQGIALRRIAPDGTEIWEKGFFSNRDYIGYEMNKSGNGHLFLLGQTFDSVHVMKVDGSGGLVWARGIKVWDANVPFSTCAPLQNGGIVVFYPFAGGQPQERFCEAKAFDANGVELWKRRLFEGQIQNDPLEWDFIDAKDLGDGTVGAVGYRGSGNFPLAARYDALTGMPIFEKMIASNNSFWSVFPMSDGVFLALLPKYTSGLTTFDLYKFSGQGELLAVQNLPLPASDYAFWSALFRAADGSIVFAGLHQNNEIKLLKLNDSLEVLDEKLLDLQPNTDWAQDLKMLPNGSFLICGEGANQNGVDVFLMKTGASGIVSSTFLKNELGFEVFPNPISAGQSLQILLENDFLGVVKIEVLSLDGRRISVFEKEKTAEKQVFEIENLPAGNSFFVRVSDEKTSAVRLVLKP